MKNTLLPLVFVFVGIVANAQTTAVTSEGDEVVLYSNGTWKYTSKVSEDEVIPVNNTPFSKGKTNSFPVKSTITNAVIGIDPKTWSFKKGEGDSEYEFDMKSKDAGAILISEKIEIPLENLKKIAVDNARSAAPDITVVKQEYRTVNGNKLLMMQMEGTIEGMKLVYLGYYYSSPAGTIQFLTYTSQNLFSEFEPNLYNLLNGLEFTK